MNIDRFNKGVWDDARAAHDEAQESGSADDYDTAADLYERAGDEESADRCRMAAQRLRAGS